MTLADLSNLPPVDPQHDPSELEQALVGTITSAILNRPRSKQVRLGPSEIGIPCSRRLAHKLAGTPEVNTRGPAWRPQVGVAVHEWLEAVFIEANRGADVAQWLVEFKVEPGVIGEQILDGKCDLYARAWDAVIDWKVVGSSALKTYRRQGPGEQYRIQAHTYGLGWSKRGLTPRHVAIMFLPSAGELEDAVFWHERYDPAVAEQAITRANAINTLAQAGGSGSAALLPTAEAHCTYCPFFLPAATDLTEACPGHAEAPQAVAS